MLLDMVPDQRKEFGAQVRAFRKRRGLSQEALAERLKMHRNSIQAIEAGRTWPEYQTRAALASELGMPESRQEPARPTPEEALAVLTEFVQHQPDLLPPDIRAAVSALNPVERAAVLEGFRHALGIPTLHKAPDMKDAASTGLELPQKSKKPRDQP